MTNSAYCLPDKIFAVTAEGRLFEESCYKVVILYQMNILLPERTPPLNSEPPYDRSVSPPLPTGVHVILVVPKPIPNLSHFPGSSSSPEGTNFTRIFPDGTPERTELISGILPICKTERLQRSTRKLQSRWETR